MYARRFNAAGFRSAALYRNLEWLQTLDFSYDMSVPSVGHLEAQRGGCCSVFPFFAGRMVELPLTTTQDYSLFHILKDHSIELWKKQLELITERHGLASFITHPELHEIAPAEGNVRAASRPPAGDAGEQAHVVRPAGRGQSVVAGAKPDEGRAARQRMGSPRSRIGTARVAFARLDAGRIAYRLSVLALLVLNGATADAATDSSTGASEAFSRPLFAVLAAVCFCLRAEGPVARTVRRTARAVLSKARR